MTVTESRSQPATPGAPPALTLWLALGAVYLIWGSTYLGIRVVVEDMPALGSMGVRFVVAGVILGGWLMVRRGRGALRVSRRSLLSAGLVGALLLLGGNGGVAIAEQTVPSGLAALLVAAMPLWLVLLRTSAGDHPRLVTVVGTAIGFLGIAVLARPGSVSDDVELWGVVVIIGATVSWAIGLFLSPRLPMPPDAFVATTWEMLLAGVLMLVGSIVSGEASDFDPGAVPAKGWVALAYLIVFGSLVAFTAFVWLAANAPVSLVSTYAYVNPVVAVLLGALILDEPITAAVVGGGGLAVIGVALVVRGERRAPPSDPPSDSPVEAAGHA